MQGQSPKAVDAGPEPDAGPKLDMVNAGPKPDAVNMGPEPDAGLKPDVGQKPKSGAEARCGAKARCRKCGAGARCRAGARCSKCGAGARCRAGTRCRAGAPCNAWGHAKRCASDHAVMVSVSKKLVSVSLTCEGGSALGLQLALPWRKGEDRRWSTREGWHDSPVMRGGWSGCTASGHSMSRHGEVKTVGGLPAKVSTTHLSCRVGGQDGRPLVIARLAMER
ncbi:hypothetical protein CRG98_021722 [Punica granatum]|uniref:Uncharacterized protein n=1 Tax=Punica granatum TaxID=22663 RepID=A0A2I0JPQ7_PUNGR|nr:hypothetical protein CRG98_021722 [Punica granatum]